MRARTFAWIVALLPTSVAQAKGFGVGSRVRHDIYDRNETFNEALDQNLRRLIVEVVSGLAPEGNLGLLFGVINLPARGFEYYVGLGYDLVPAISLPIQARYVFNISGYRFYAALGYCYRRLEPIGVESHNAFAELGYKWVLERTLHFTIGVGLRRPLLVNVLDDSAVSTPDTDPALLDLQVDRSRVWVPTLALRFSRAF